uniref:glycosyltransferase family 4 protein n=1 Tax=Amycolatopsis pittospori TaxID=2749434 RepID=UPI0015F0208A
RVPNGRTLSVAVHDTVPWTHPETLTPRGVAWHKAVIARAARRATALTVPTQAIADELAELMPITVPVRVIPHGVRPHTSFEEIALPERYVLAIGTIEPRKGIDVLIDAVGRIGVPLVLAGQPGWGGIDPAGLAREHGADVRLLGKVTDAQLAFALRGASVLAMPSRAEGFGLPLIEAMAAGVPVVHSDVPALVEVAGGAGVVVPVGDAQALADALKDVLGSPGRAAALRDGGLSRSSEFTWQRAAYAVWGLHLRDQFVGSPPLG